MAEGKLKGAVASNEQLMDGHRIIYTFNVYRLDAIKRTFYPLEYNTKCPAIPTSWQIELKYERVPEDNGTYTFSIVLMRKDTSDHRVKASFFVHFFNVHGTAVFYPISSSLDRMTRDDELYRPCEGILPSMLGEVATVQVIIAVENCHAGTLQCASKVNTDKNSINLSKL